MKRKAITRGSKEVSVPGCSHCNHKVGEWMGDVLEIVLKLGCMK